MKERRLHSGHRERMREKFIKYGKDAFHSHELLEMLLYNAIPIRDTNESAIMLLDEFSGLDGVMSQTKDKLTCLGGIGDRAAELILSVGRLTLESVFSAAYSKEKVSDTDIGNYFAGYFHGKTSSAVAVVLLNNRSEPIAFHELYNTDYGSASVKAEGFISVALKEHASAIAIAHNHPFGAPFPTPQDIETNKAVNAALSAAGIALVEHYIVSGSRYRGFMNGIEGVLCAKKNADESENDVNLYELDILSDILSYRSEISCADARLLLRKFVNLRGLAEADVYSISDTLSGNMQTAVYIKLAFSLLSRRMTEKFRFKIKHSEEEICEYLKALMLDLSVETAYLLLFSGEGKITACESVSVGTVNYSEILPRRILELSRRHSAREVIIAHNHPCGRAVASSEDIQGTERLACLLSEINIKLKNHYIVAGGECNAVPLVR